MASGGQLARNRGTRWGTVKNVKVVSLYKINTYEEMSFGLIT